MTFVILDLLGSNVENDYILRIWALGCLLHSSGLAGTCPVQI